MNEAYNFTRLSLTKKKSPSRATFPPQRLFTLKKTLPLCL
nr:MAG TPA: hypothetical protein [Caudoviricetes sp.]